MTKQKDEREVYRQDVGLNPSQLALLLLPAKNIYAILSRATGKSYVMGYLIDENVRLMPRGITSITQSNMLQALTKTLPSAFKMLEKLGYKRYDPKTRTGDYVIRRTPPDGWYLPYEQILNYEYSITFSNGHMLYIFSQDGNSRGPSVDYNISDEALTLDKEQFDQESAPTNRGNEHVWGHLSSTPLMKHHGNAFLSSMPWDGRSRWLLEPAAYYKEEKGIDLFQTWNRIVSLQMQLIQLYLDKDKDAFRDCWNQTCRLRKEITPFVSSQGTLFMLSNVFDNIANVGMRYIIQEYLTMDKLAFMVEVLDYLPEVVDDCYYQLSEAHIYRNAVDSSYIQDFAENVDFSMERLSGFSDCRSDADLLPSLPIDACVDWGATYSFMIMAQLRNFDFSTHEISQLPIQDIINCIYLQRDEEEKVLVVALADAFCSYYEHHATKVMNLYVDRHGDARSASSKKTYNEIFIEVMERHGWEVYQYRARGQEPPQHDKYLLVNNMLKGADPKYPKLRFNGDKCRYLIGSMNNTRVVQKDGGKFTKDKSSEHNKNLPQEFATHFGDCFDKFIWTKYNSLLKTEHSFVDSRF